MKKWLIGIGILVIVAMISACQVEKPLTSEGTDALEEKPKVLLEHDGEGDLPVKSVKECWEENCSEETANRNDGSIKEKTEGLNPVTIQSDSEIQVIVEGKQPDRMSYQKLEENSSTVENVTGPIDIHGDGRQYFLLTAEWRTEEGAFQGSKTVGFILDVEGKEELVQKKELSETSFIFQGETYPADYHVICMNETSCEASPTNVTEPFEEWKDDVEPAEIGASIGDEVTINFADSLSPPDSLYIRKQQGATGTAERVENTSIEIMGEEGPSIRYIIHAKWEEDGQTVAHVQFVFFVPNPTLS